MVVDPVCGMEVKDANATERSTFGGRTYFFCSAACRERFERDPVRFTEPSSTPSS